MKLPLWNLAKPLVRLKWRRDQQFLPLGTAHYEIYTNIHLHAVRMGSRFPNLIRPVTYRDHLIWLMLFDQSEQIARCADKLYVREFVAGTIGEEYLVPLKVVLDDVDSEKLRAIPPPWIVKLSDDSGSYRVVVTEDSKHLEEVVERLRNRQARRFGWDKGEWVYRLGSRKILVEEYLGDPAVLSAPEEFKFHCVDGKIRWAQFIVERFSGAREVVVNRAGAAYPFQFVAENQPLSWQGPPAEWHRLCSLAEKLAYNFRYVRVDFLLHHGRIYFGEMTFFPRAGYISRRANRVFGRFMDFDRRDVRPPAEYSDAWS